eukprot:gene1878-33295_t
MTRAVVLAWAGLAVGLLCVALQASGDTTVVFGTSEQITRLVFPVPPISENLLTGRLLQGGDASSNSTIIGDGDDGNAVVIVDPKVPIVVTDRGSSRDFTHINGVVPISTIVFILRGAGKAPTITLDSLKSRWLNKDNFAGSNSEFTMENYFKFCSYGKTMMDSNNDVVDLRFFGIPQTGITPISKSKYEINTCDWPELLAYQEFAADQFTKMGGNLSKFTRRIVVMPPNRCTFYGGANQGCFGKYCHVWIRSDSTYRFSTWFHELGHTLSLQHSTTTLANGQVIEYGDSSCAMGLTNDRGYFAAPSAARAGWALSIATLTKANLTAGAWKYYNIPSVRRTDTNYVRVFPDWDTPTLGWVGKQFPGYYFSYRTLENYDKWLQSSFIRSGASIYDGFKPNLIGGAGVTAGSTYNDTNIGLVMVFTQANATHGDISLCCYTETVETDCFDGLDNDCNGLKDREDPACAGAGTGFCGDRVCTGSETPATCPADCPAKCGDGLCTLPAESPSSCPADCKARCEDGVCQGDLNAGNCPAACPALCGDKMCTHSETFADCPTDCQSICGDKICNTNRDIETCANCPPGIKTVGGISDFCKIQVSVNAPFCFDHNPASSVCECNQGPSGTSRAVGYNSYTYSCNGATSSPHTLRYTPGFRQHWCASSRGTWGHTSVDQCANYCKSVAGSTPPFCFDFNAQINHCECSSGPDASQPSLNYNSYTYSCTSAGRRLTSVIIAASMTKEEFVIDSPEKVFPESAVRIVVPYKAELHTTVSPGAQRRLASHEGAREQNAFCGNKVCEGGEDGENCAMDCCPKTTCGDGVCQAYAGEECESCPEDCAGDLDGEHGAPFCCGAYVGCNHDERCTGNMFWDGKEHECLNHCGKH